MPRQKDFTSCGIFSSNNIANLFRDRECIFTEINIEENFKSLGTMSQFKLSRKDVALWRRTVSDMLERYVTVQEEEHDEEAYLLIGHPGDIDFKNEWEVNGYAIQGVELCKSTKTDSRPKYLASNSKEPPSTTIAASITSAASSTDTINKPAPIPAAKAFGDSVGAEAGKPKHPKATRLVAVDTPVASQQELLTSRVVAYSGTNSPSDQHKSMVAPGNKPTPNMPDSPEEGNPELFRTGDIVQYYWNSTWGDPRGLKQATVTKVDSSDEYPLTLSTGDKLIPGLSRVRKVKGLASNSDLKEMIDMKSPTGEDAFWRALDTYKFEDGGDGTAADAFRENAARFSESANDIIKKIKTTNEGGMRLDDIFCNFTGGKRGTTKTDDVAKYNTGADGNDDKQEEVGDFSKMKVVVLKEKLRELNLPVSGRKQELIDRLTERLYPNLKPSSMLAEDDEKITASKTSSRKRKKALANSTGSKNKRKKAKRAKEEEAKREEETPSSDANGASNTNARARAQWSSRNVGGQASQDAIRALTAPNVDAIGTDLVTARGRRLEYTSNTIGLRNCHLRALQSVSPEAAQQAIREGVNCNDHDRVTEILAEHVSKDRGRVIQLRRHDKRNLERHWVSITPEWFTDDANCFHTKNYAVAVAVLEMLEYSEKDFGGMTTSVEAMLENPNPVRPVTNSKREKKLPPNASAVLVAMASAAAGKLSSTAFCDGNNVDVHSCMLIN